VKQPTLHSVSPHSLICNFNMRTTALFFLALVSSATAFAPASSKHTSTQLHAESSRRDALAAMGLAFGGLMLPQESEAFNNPALQTFKARKRTKGSFTPGKGLHNTQEFDNLVAGQNPALQTFKGRKKTAGSFIPGKGLHNSQEFDNLVAGQNPALQTFKARKRTAGSFIPGKGLHNNDTFESLMG
jgi:hypothetical protein